VGDERDAHKAGDRDLESSETVGRPAFDSGSRDDLTEYD
jgi:hypothetical protein